MAERKKKYYQRPDGLYESIRTINGKRVAFRGKTCKEVDRKILEYREEAQKGRKFPVIADEWEREHEPKISESTRRVYGVAVRRLKEAFPGCASEVRPLDVQRYIAAFEKQGRSANSVQIELAVCKMIFAHAVMQGDIDVSPAAEVRKSRGLPTKKREALTEEQEETVKAAGRAQEARFWMFPYLLLYTGMRRGEALALSYSDIDRKAGVIHVTKKLSYAYGQRPQMEDHLKSSNGKRDIPLLPPLAAALPRNRVGLIFPGEDGGFMRASEITTNWRAYCRDVGLNEFVRLDDGQVKETFPITPHCFRHSFATICYEAGLDPRQAAEILGDTPEVLEGVYTHLRAGQRRTAAELLAAYTDCVAMG
jgi:integrase